MEATITSSSPLPNIWAAAHVVRRESVLLTKIDNPNQALGLRRRRRSKASMQKKKKKIIAAINSDVIPVSSPPDLHLQAQLTWQILVGALAGVTPFMVAGIEFSKRIIAQRRCEECGGSGLVLRDNDYFRCPGCGGFLPWQSWKRFFTG